MDFVQHQRAPKNHLPGIGFVAHAVGLVCGAIMGLIAAPVIKNERQPE